MESKNNMKNVIVKNGVYDLGKGEIAIINEGTLRIYKTSQKLISEKMKKAKSIKEVLEWLEERQKGQIICFIEEGAYFSDTIIIEVADKNATIYPKEDIVKEDILV